MVEAKRQTVNQGQYKDLTRADCRKLEISGLRQCKISGSYEIWILGQLVEEVPASTLAMNPRAHIEAYARVFGLDPETLDI